MKREIMNSKKIISVMIGVLLAANSVAGVIDLTIHSRANCVNNESISWHRGDTQWLLTVSDHLFNGDKHHSLSSGWENTWRSANVHWGESPIGSTAWSVQAGHYQNVGGRDYLLGFTKASDCNIYDGWWG